MLPSSRYEAIIKQGRTLSELQRLYWCVGVRYDNNHVPVRRDNQCVALNFADVAGFELISPAFVDPSSVPVAFSDGTAGPSDDSVMDSFLRGVAGRNGWATYHLAEFQSEEGRRLPYMYLSNSAHTVAASASSSQKLKVWIQGGVHGNEPAGDQCLLALLGKMDAHQTWTQCILDTMDILLLPRYNLDGVAYFQRALATNLDPNRDHVKLATQQTRDIKRLFSDFAPHIAIDLHEFRASSRYGGHYVHASDALFSAAKNLNIDADIRRMSEDLFATSIGNDLEAAGLRWEPYVTDSGGSTPGGTICLAEAGSDAKIGRNAMGLTQSITFLCEMRGIGLADQHFQRRTVTGLVMAESIIQTASDHAGEVYRTVMAGVDNFMSSTEDIIITDSSNCTERTFQMVDVRNGSLVDAPVQFASTTPTSANLTRARPAAYIIPDTWSELVHRLEVSGLQVTRLQQSSQASVEVLNITSVHFDQTYYEGVVPVAVTTVAHQKEVELPAGSFVVNTRQRNAALAFVALEPENIDSYVSFNIIPVEEGDEYPIYRLMGPFLPQ